MHATTFADFEAAALAQGFDLVLERRWAPDTVLDTHTHPFAVQALVVDGEMWLDVAGYTRHPQAGDSLELPRGVPHAERYGSAGATHWGARRS